MIQLSYCHNAPITRTRFSNRMVCSSCGMYVSMKKLEPYKIEEKEVIPGFPNDKPIRAKEPDDRNMIRHLSDPKKYSACGIRGFRTTDKKRVNCKKCIVTEFYLKN